MGSKGIHSVKTLGTTTRHYYKYDKTNPIDNYSSYIVGSVTDNNGVLSGFSTSNYLQIPMPSWNNIECVIKFRVSSLSTKQFLCGDAGSNLTKVPNFSITTAGSVRYIYSYNQTLNTVSNANINTWYWVKLTYDGTTQTIWLSTNGINWEQGGSRTATVSLGGGNWWVGNSTDGGNYYPKFPLINGEIDIKECYVKFHGEYWWQGVTYPVIDGTASDYDYYIDTDDIKTLVTSGTYKGLN